MEKESDIEDILSYRSIAECELQHILSSLRSEMVTSDALTAVEKSQADERAVGKTRGWLNWLSRGMLGAGGTEDSSQFSGVISDDVVKDIYEATKFHPLVSSNGSATDEDRICLCAIKFDIHQISATLVSLKYGLQVAKMIFISTLVECNIWMESAAISISVNSIEMVNPLNQRVIYFLKLPFFEKNVEEINGPSCSFQIDVSPKLEPNVSVKAMLSPMDITFDVKLFLLFSEFFNGLKYFESQNRRVLTSLNGIENVEARVLSKAEYIMSSRKKVLWDITVTGVTINVPWNTILGQRSLVLQLGAICVTSKYDWSLLSSRYKERSFMLKGTSDSILASDIAFSVQPQNLYDQFDIQLQDFEMEIRMPSHSQSITIFEKCSASIALRACLIPNESIFKQLQALFLISPLHAHFSPIIYGAALELAADLCTMISNPGFEVLENLGPLNMTSNGQDSYYFGFSLGVTLQSVRYDIDLGNDEKNDSALVLSLEDIEIRYDVLELEELWICMNTLNIAIYHMSGVGDEHILCSCGNKSFVTSAHLHGIDNRHETRSDSLNDLIVNGGKCCILHLDSSRKDANGITIYLNNAEIHCYPYILGLLIEFYERLSACNTTFNCENSFGSKVNDEYEKPMISGCQRFGFSNFMNDESTEHASIPLYCFPFVTLYNSGLLDSLESSLIYANSEWRKHYKIRDRKIINTGFGLEKGPIIFLTQPTKPKCDVDSSVALGSSCHSSVHAIDLNICGMKVHFHDSSCIVGSVMLPTCKSSLLICEDYLDLLCSVEGLAITSSWTRDFPDPLWGPLLPYLSPIFNIRVRKEKSVSLSAKLEISIGVQHVCCILPHEYLAMIIGYFALPDWSSKSKEQYLTGQHEHAAIEETSIVFKFEIVDSALILPVESNELQFLRFEIKQLYCSFFFAGSLDDALKEIPLECTVPVHKIARMNHCLNLYGRDLFLSLLLFKGRNGSSVFYHSNECQNITLVELLNADVWIRMPCENEFINESSPAMCIMTMIRNCKVIVDDDHAFCGFWVLVDNITQFASVQDQSRCFKSDVLQFLQLMRCQKEGTSILFPVSNTTVTEFKCYIDSLFLKMNRIRNELLEVGYNAELQFTCSGSLRNDVVTRIEFSFCLMVLYSLLKSVNFAKCCSEHLSSPVLAISISRSSQGPFELSVCLPSIDVWLYLSEWIDIVDLFKSYVRRMTQFMGMGTHSKNLTLNNSALGDTSITAFPNRNFSSTSSDLVIDNIEPDDPVLIITLKDVGITFHFPTCVKESHSGIQLAEVEEKAHQNVSSDIMEGKYFRFIMVTFHGRSEVNINSKKVSVKSDMEKVCGMLSRCEEKGVQSCPLFQMFGVNLEVHIKSEEMKLLSVRFKIQCECLNIWLSYHVFYFWKHTEFNLPETDSSISVSCPIEFEVQLKKVSFLLSDGRWSCCRPLLEILIRSILMRVYMTENIMEDFITGELNMNYNNVQKVFWEPFIEPWNFTLSVTRKQESRSLLNSSVLTDIHLMSSSQLNLNLTESFTECLSRTIEMIKEAWGLIITDDIPQRRIFLNSPYVENIIAGKHAPYILQNLTSLPLEYHIYEGPINSVEFGISEYKEKKYVQPGFSVPIFISESAEEQFFRHRSFHSLEKLGEQHAYGVGHHFISIQLDGTSVPSVPISMDLVGQTYFEVDFSKVSNEEVNMPDNMSKDVDNMEKSRIGSFIVPVVFDVSVQRYGKLIQLYSTVVLFNQTSMPLEFRFDIPFGLSPKILDPLHPGQAMPLPLHLAESGCISWRPSENSYLWSKTCNLSNLLAQESKIGLFRSFVSYPPHLSSYPFRCCISTRKIILPSHQKARKIGVNLMQPVSGSHPNIHHLADSQGRCIHQLILCTPLAVRSFLPEEVKVLVDTSGMIHSAILSEVKTFFHHIDPSHDLEFEIHVHGYKPSYVKFPRAETFCAIAKFGGTKYSLSEPITLIPGPIQITIDKSMDAFSGSRELNIFAPFLLYNCTGIPLRISESTHELKGVNITLPSYNSVVEPEQSAVKRGGLGTISSCSDSNILAPRASLIKKPVSTTEYVNSQMGSLKGKAHISPIHHTNPYVQSNKNDSNVPKFFQNTSKESSGSSDHTCARDSESLGFEQEKVRAHMFSPCKLSSADEVMVRLRRSLPEWDIENIRSASWSSPFHLVPRSGSATVLIPQSSPSAAFVISVTSSAISGPFAELTSVITFQPRYVISNASSKDLCYKQKGTEFTIPLAVGEHSHLQWKDTTRDLLVSVRYNEPGWQWSGSFLPDPLGDTQVKMRNYITGSSNILRVEVQNADVSTDSRKIVGNGHGNSGTNLILLSDDDTGYIPYRIDNFSKERLRIYQQRCETFETTVHPYTSYSYSWDEPCYPRRLTVEVPGERILGSYALDDVQDFMPVCLPSTTGKNERTLHLSVHAEGTIKVLSIIDSTYHIPSVPHFGEKKKNFQKQEKTIDYQEKVSVFFSYIGVSLINSFPEEVVYACAKNITIDLLQSLDQQKFSLKLLSLQIDNQYRNSPYPVILSFDQEYRSSSSGSMKKEIGSVTRSERVLQADGFREPVFYLYASKWRKTDSLLVSFEHISLRIPNFRLEIEQQVMLGLLEFVKNVSSNLKGDVLQFSDTKFYSSSSSSDLPENNPTYEYLNSRTEPLHFLKASFLDEIDENGKLLPSVFPIGAPWQQVYLLARRQKKVYVELFDLAPIKLTLSFSSFPWVLKNTILSCGELLVHRGLLALGDIEGAQIHLKRLNISHHMASWESIQEILISHYSRQLFHEMYKVFGSAGVIGNPMGFARRVGIGIRDFLSVPAKNILQSPTGLITGMAQGTTSLLSNTVYAFSDATTQFSNAARKGIVAFTFDDQAVSRIGPKQTGVSSHSEGVISEVLEGLTGLLQSPIKGAERHGLPGVFSGIALGITGLVAKPAASVLELTGKTAQSIRNRSRLYQMRPQRLRVRLPRPLSSMLPLRPFSWEEAIGTSVLLEAGDDMKFHDEVLVTCKALKQAGKFVIITQRVILIINCASLVDLGKPEFRGIAADSKWVIESAVGLETIIHADTDGAVVHIIGSSSDLLIRQNKFDPKKVIRGRTNWWTAPALPIFQTNLELEVKEDAENMLKILLSTIELAKERGWHHGYVLHQYDVK